MNVLDCYKMIFSSTLSSVGSAMSRQQISEASLKEISSFLPQIDEDKQIDLLPIAFNACVVNQGNKRGDGITTDIALATYKDFINKPINVEHEKEKVVGFISNAGFSEVGTDRPLTEQEVAGLKKPFYITLGGLLWRVVDKTVTSAVEEASNPLSKNFKSISASWELAFINHTVVKTKKETQDFDGGEWCEDIKAIASASKNLKAFGGAGTDGEHNYFRVPYGTVIPLGVALTISPAGNVAGVATALSKEDEMVASDFVKEEPDKKDEKPEEKQKNEDKKECGTCKKADKASDDELEECDCPECGKKTKMKKVKANTSQNHETNVIKTEEPKFMKISKITDITDESLKVLTASAITEFIIEADKQYKEEKDKSENALKIAQTQMTELNANFEKQSKELLEVKAALTKLQEENLQREAVASFNTRMATLDEKYNLSEDAKKAVLLDVKSAASDEAFGAWLSKMEVFFKPFEKKAEVKTQEAKASTDAVVDEALEKAEKEKLALANAASQNSSKNKWADVLKDGTFSVK